MASMANVGHDAPREIMNDLRTAYRAATGIEAEMFVTRAAAGPRVTAV